MDRTSFADAGICAIVNSRYVPVRVDPDRRPDVSLRYGLGGWPTTAFLTAEGLVLGGGTYVEAARLGAILERVCEAVAAGRHLGAKPVTRSQPGSRTATAASVRELAQQVMDSFDPRHGGFGHSPKFPLAAPVRLAMALYRETGEQQYYDAAVTSLDAMGWGPLYDEERGGFFSYSEDADWGRPNTAKLLEVNASLLSLYVEALETFQFARYGERAEDVLRYTQTWLADPVDAGWGASERADGSDDAAVDRTLYSDKNALMTSAALRAGRTLDDPSLSEFAIKSIERVLGLAYRPGAGVAHFLDAGEPQVRGLLDDQIAMGTASLDAFDATGDPVYEMMAEELALQALRTLWDAEAGGFFDRSVDPRRDIGLLKQPVKPVSVNALAAGLLRRLAKTARSAEFDDYAARTLAAVADRAGDEGPLAAEYVLAAGLSGQ